MATSNVFSCNNVTNFSEEMTNYNNYSDIYFGSINTETYIDGNELFKDNLI